jgi:hypothetical protein
MQHPESVGIDRIAHQLTDRMQELGEAPKDISVRIQADDDRLKAMVQASGRRLTARMKAFE